MLTVIRAMADAVAERRAQWLRDRLDPRRPRPEQNALLAEMLATALFAGEEAVRHTPEQLDVLAEAGVVDAGALGLVVIIRGMVAGLAGERGAAAGDPALRRRRASTRSTTPTRAYRFCTNFIVTGEGLDGRLVRAASSSALGDSVLVVGDEATLKVHVHTDDPDAAKALFDDAGEVEQRGHRRHARAGRRPAGAARRPAAPAVVAVASGDGMRDDVRGPRRRRRRRRADAQPVDQGPARRDRATRPPSEVVVLPNSRNVIMAAEEAARLAEKSGRGGRRRAPAQQAGARGAGRVRRPTPSAAGNAERLGEALAGIRVGAVAPAARDDAEGRFRRGDSVGFAGDEIVAWGGAGSTLLETVAALADGAEIVTVIEGAEAPIPLDELDARAARRRRARAPARRDAELLVADRRPVARCSCLLDEVLEAHGGRERWRARAPRSAPGSQSGGLLLRTRCPAAARRTPCSRSRSASRGRARSPMPTRAGAASSTTARCGSRPLDGEVLESRPDPRPLFFGRSGLRRNLRWDALDATYFAGYALWNYLDARRTCSPARRCAVRRAASRWRPGRRDAGAGSRLSFPAGLDTHRPRQVFYYDARAAPAPPRLHRRGGRRLGAGGAPVRRPRRGRRPASSRPGAGSARRGPRQPAAAGRRRWSPWQLSEIEVEFE